MRRTRLGWLGPAIVTAGAAIAGVGVWYVVHAKPEAGATIDTIAIDASSRLVIRAEADGDRAFVELWDGDRLRWQALVPHYAGSPTRRAIAWSPTAISIRVERHGRAEVFALATRDAVKLGGFRLGVEHEPIETEPAGPITLGDRGRSYEFVGGTGWHEVVAVDLQSGHALWKTALGPTPVSTATIDGDTLRIAQGTTTRALDLRTGRDANATIVGNHL